MKSGVKRSLLKGNFVVHGMYSKQSDRNGLVVGGGIEVLGFWVKWGRLCRKVTKSVWGYR